MTHTIQRYSDLNCNGFGSLDLIYAFFCIGGAPRILRLLFANLEYRVRNSLQIDDHSRMNLHSMQNASYLDVIRRFALPCARSGRGRHAPGPGGLPLLGRPGPRSGGSSRIAPPAAASSSGGGISGGTPARRRARKPSFQLNNRGKNNVKKPTK
jgi:hypothetical protein